LAAKEAGLNYTQIGIVFGINPLGSIVFSLVIGSLISVWGRRKCMVGALIA
jgi:MFS family permease